MDPDPDSTESLERILFKKIKRMEQVFEDGPGIKLSIKKRQTDSSMSYVRRCKTVSGDFEYDASWGIPRPSPPASPIPRHVALLPASQDEEPNEEEGKDNDENEDNDRVKSDEDYAPPSSEDEPESESENGLEEESEDLCVIRRTQETQETTQNTSEGTVAAETPSPVSKYRLYCNLCDNLPCVSITTDAMFLLARVQKKYDDADNVDTDFLQKLSEEFVDGYCLLKQHQEYVPGDDGVSHVNIPMCMYHKFHEWAKDLI